MVSTYHSEISWVDGSLTARRDRQGDQRLRTSHLNIYPARGHPGDAVCAGDDTVFELHYENLSGQPVRNLEVTIGIYDFLGRAMTFLENAPVGVRIDTEIGWELPVRSPEAPSHPRGSTSSTSSSKNT